MNISFCLRGVRRSRRLISTSGLALALALAMTAACGNGGHADHADHTATANNPSPTRAPTGTSATAAENEAVGTAVVPALNGSSTVTSDDGYTIRVDYQLNLTVPTRDPQHEKPGFTAAFSKVVGAVSVTNTTPGREITFGFESMNLGAGDAGPYSGAMVLQAVYEPSMCQAVNAPSQNYQHDACVLDLAHIPMSDGTAMKPWRSGETRKLRMLGSIATSTDAAPYFPYVLDGNIPQDDGPTIFAGIPESSYSDVVHRLLHPSLFVLSFMPGGPVGGNWHRDCATIATSAGRTSCE